MTVKTRITLFIVGAGFVSSLLFSVVVFYELIEQPFDLLDTVLKEEASRTVRMIVKTPEKTDPAELDTLYRELDRYWLEISDRESGKILFRSKLAELTTLPPVPPGGKSIAKAVIAKSQVDLNHEKDQEVTFRIRSFLFTLNGNTFLAQIARPMEKLEEEIWELVLGIFSGLVFSTLALVAISRFVAGKILRPIGRMKDLAQDIGEKNLDRRIPVGDGQDEFSELARTVNRMLDRLQYSFKRQRDFLFDTSHELKTPLTTMRLAIDEICIHDLEAAPLNTEENLFRLKNQVLRMERLVKDLLNLSALETLTRLDRKPVPIASLLSSLAAEYRFLADARQITMETHLSERLIIQGDAEKLHRAFSNILDNAVKYNTDGGRIELTAAPSAAGAAVTVFNTGPGIAEAEIPKVFDQFYRVEKSRSIQHGGSGLGLAIVKRIVELHGGTVRLESRQGAWTRVTILLPEAGNAARAGKL
jgi:signal transduction histidine kinase